ncbi:DnaJ domain-containing protein [Ferdinandcohnia quinoae]|uniref:DnaJ domain-containing protein n=1 Tax=Fredinandcohnia quinoae TaxID=2918902 RepID=A0AAW5EA44_9BACI|nr:DnaJ domain-containing protein [Fredinandcohnia sp. SECRCQ15]MCH1625998.1 DnaJ domain-containing protein [Fredinandcohnia sp. SECRCQ15]
MNNYYDQLGIEPSATRDEVKNAYRRLAKKYHPDVNHGDPDAESRFKAIKIAYETLYSTTLREKYDAKQGIKQHAPNGDTQSKHANGEMSNHGFDPAAVHQTFEQFFGFNPKTKESTRKKGEQQKKNPLDTSEMFNQYFGRR